MTDARKQAETLALQALAWVVADDAVFESFVAATGVDGRTLRDNAGDPAFLGGVLDFLMQDDGWITGFCRAHGLGPDAPFRARSLLPGGNDPHWT